MGKTSGRLLSGLCMKPLQTSKYIAKSFNGFQHSLAFFLRCWHKLQNVARSQTCCELTFLFFSGAFVLASMVPSVCSAENSAQNSCTVEPFVNYVLAIKILNEKFIRDKIKQRPSVCKGYCRLFHCIPYLDSGRLVLEISCTFFGVTWKELWFRMKRV